ncbi:MAG TPA: hypothetical protein VGY55_13865 [Pirellulales bacterium]|nr:hypothetical protein [Pirellulales bacterium]
MTKLFRRTRAVWLMAGVLAAAMVGGMLSGVVLHWFSPAGDDRPLADGFFKAINAHASATNSQESLILATGEVDTAIEAVYTLDPLTGELRGAVLNPAKGGFAGRFSYPNLAKDFEGVKNPKFLMVTGVAEMRQGYRGGKFARSAVYVAEVTSGKVVAYGVPWDPTKAASPQGYVGTLIPLGAFTARDTSIRQ